MYASVYESVHVSSFMYGLYGRGMVCMHPCFFACADSVHVALSDLPSGLCGPNQMVGNINFTIPFSSSPFLSSYLLV